MVARSGDASGVGATASGEHCSIESRQMHTKCIMASSMGATGPVHSARLWLKKRVVYDKDLGGKSCHPTIEIQ